MSTPCALALGRCMLQAHIAPRGAPPVPFLSSGRTLGRFWMAAVGRASLQFTLVEPDETFEHRTALLVLLGPFLLLARKALDEGWRDRQGRLRRCSSVFDRWSEPASTGLSLGWVAGAWMISAIFSRTKKDSTS